MKRLNLPLFLDTLSREDGQSLKNDIVKFQKKFKKDLVSFSYVGKALSSTKVRVLSAISQSETSTPSMPENAILHIFSLSLLRAYITPFFCLLLMYKKASIPNSIPPHMPKISPIMAFLV